MSDLVRSNPLAVAVISAVLGGGIGSGGTTFFTKTDAATIKAEVDSFKTQMDGLQTQVSKIWEKKADVNYIDLKIQAMCR